MMPKAWVCSGFDPAEVIWCTPGDPHEACAEANGYGALSDRDYEDDVREQAYYELVHAHGTDYEGGDRNVT